MNFARSLTLLNSDTALIARCQKADIAAFNEIVGAFIRVKSTTICTE